MFAAVVLLLAVFTLQATRGLRKKFTTFDEAYYLCGGYSYLITGDTRMANRYHPPLAQVLVAVPLLGLHLERPERDPAWSAPKSDLTSHTLSLNFLYRNRVPWQTMLTRGRLMMVALGALVGLFVFLWAAELGGLGAGFLALTLYAFSPNLLAHTRLTTTDFPVAGLSFVACYLLWRFFRRPELLRLVLVGLVLGLALLAKLSALIFGGIVVLLAGLYVLVPGGTISGRAGWRGRLDETLGRRRVSRGVLAVVALVVIFALACGVIWLGYLGATSAGSREEFIREACSALAAPTPSSAGVAPKLSLGAGLFSRVARFIPWPKQYWELLSWLLAKSQGGHRAFLAGRFTQTGWWYYFPFVLAVKTPLPTLVLVLVGLTLGWRRGRRFDWWFLVLPPAVFLLVSMTSRINIGYRHILPMVPFLLVFGSQVAGWDVARAWHKWVPAGVLLTWYVAGTMHVAPHYLAYFNELVGGPRQGYRYLVDSNLDWGQDLLGVRDYAREHNIDKVKMAYFGMITPDIIRSLGIPYESITKQEEHQPTPGIYAISATRLQGAYGTGLFGEDAEKPFPWLRKLEPEAVIGYTIFVYRVTEADVAQLQEQER